MGGGKGQSQGPAAFPSREGTGQVGTSQGAHPGAFLKVSA